MSTLQTWRARLKRTWLDPFHISHQTLEQRLREHQDAIAGRVLDVGCGAKPYRRLFPEAYQYCGTETNRTFTRGAAPDVIALGDALPFQEGRFDAVVCTQVLEHVADPLQFLRELFRVTRSGGALLLSTPMTWGLHEEPYDFYRYTKYGLEYLLGRAGFRLLAIRPTTGTLATVGQRLSSFCYYRLGGRRPALKPLAVGVSALIQMLFMAGDYLAGHHGDTLDWVALARKPGTAGVLPDPLA